MNTSIDELHADGRDAADFINDITPFLYGKALTFVDVGAHLGDVYKALAQSKLYIRHAHLVEPSPDIFRELTRAITSTNRGRFIHYHNVAMGASQGFVTMQSEGRMSHVVKDVQAGLPTVQHEDVFRVEVLPLRDLVQKAGIKHINLLKIDVEGFEMEVLEGARELLSSNRIDVIYIEAGLSKDAGQQTYYRSIEDFLADYGYKVFRIYEQRNEWPVDSAALRRANFAFMSKEFLERNPFKVSTELFKARQQLRDARRELKEQRLHEEKLSRTICRRLASLIGRIRQLPNRR